MSDENVKKYKDKELTVFWKPELCIHAGECVKGAPGVFNPKTRPWIQLQYASNEDVKKAVDNCPSGALTYIDQNEEKKEVPAAEESGYLRIKASKNGPLMVQGSFEMEDRDGNVQLCKGKAIALCRCGSSRNKPFCDGTHVNVKFFG
ncbi:MAG: (4Fe-4S)-binding protein [Acidobacteria bacterium]|nr:(4Fe-4S)-binding protein [Acidobacteriota bacterium]